MGKEVRIEIFGKGKIQKMAAQRFVHGMTINNMYLETTGRGGVQEMCARSAHMYAEGLQKRDNRLFPFYNQMDALNMCLEWAAERKNQWGSTVRVRTYDGYVQLETQDCAVLGAALEMGRERKEFCGLCQLWHITAMKDLGLKLDIELTDKGCQYKLYRGNPPPPPPQKR